jgi:DNA replication and repair protein RecF
VNLPVMAGPAMPRPGVPSVDAPAHRALLRHLTVRDFRNLAHLDLDAPTAGFVVVGDNGHGKTNLLEAIYYLHLFRSMRGARDAELVRFGTPAFHVAARVDGTEHDSVAAGYERASGRKKLTLNGVERGRMSDALGALPSVTFAPADVGIIGGAPVLRRRLLDIALASTSRRYLAALQMYRTALAQRNASLRGADACAQAAAWETQLAEHGAVLREERGRWLEWAGERFARMGDALGERDPLALRYRSSVEIDRDASSTEMRDALALALARHRERDVARGLTHAGPHRDDLDVRLGAVSLRRFGSAGQQRTAAIALRLLECAWYRERSGREPVVLMDDPLAELDPRRASRVLSLLTDGADTARGQVVLAVPRADDIPAALRGLARFRIRDGVLLTSDA